jgi:hypothetical protein
MKTVLMCTVAVAAFVVAATAGAGKLSNTSFELDFGQRANQNVWGDFGDAWGEAYQVTTGTAKHPKKTRTGIRMLLINVPPGSWDGVWQQAPWAEKMPFAVSGWYLIRGGDLPENCTTFLKAEFRDSLDAQISIMESARQRADTRGQWTHVTLSGQTPPGTAAIRFVVIAGDNANGTNIVDRIYWDDVDTTE